MKIEKPLVRNALVGLGAALLLPPTTIASTDAYRIDTYRGKVLTSDGKSDAGETTDSPRFQIFTKRDGKNSRAEFRFRNDFDNPHTITFVGEMRVLKWSSSPDAGNVSVAQTLSDAAEPGDGAKPLSQLALNRDLEFYEVHAPRDGNGQACMDSSTGEPARIRVNGGYRTVKIVYDQQARSSQMFVQTSEDGPLWPCPVVTSETRYKGDGRNFAELYTKIGAYHLGSGDGNVQVQWRNFSLSGDQ